MTPTTHWSTTGQLHTGTVAGCKACEGDAELLASYRAHVGYKPSAGEVTVPDDGALDATARTWSRTGGLAPLIDPGNALAEHWRRVAQDLEAGAAEVRANERRRVLVDVANEIEAELICCPENDVVRHHHICRWGHAARRIVLGHLGDMEACEVLGLRPERLQRVAGMPMADFRRLEHQVLAGCGFHAFYGDDCAVCADANRGEDRETAEAAAEGDLRGPAVRADVSGPARPAERRTGLRGDDDAAEGGS